MALWSWMRHRQSDSRRGYMWEEHITSIENDHLCMCTVGPPIKIIFTHAHNFSCLCEMCTHASTHKHTVSTPIHPLTHPHSYPYTHTHTHTPTQYTHSEENFANETLQHHIEVMGELVARDKNRPSVVMWSLANEPSSNMDVAKDYFE